MKTKYTYLTFDKSGNKRKTFTRGKFAGFTERTGILNCHYAIFVRRTGDVLVPEYMLTPETREKLKDPNINAVPEPVEPTLQEIQVKARFGHRDWLFWRGKDGKTRAERRSAEAIKTMLLETGTQGFWYLVMANDGRPMKGFWAMGLNIFAQSKRGWA